MAAAPPCASKLAQGKSGYIDSCLISDTLEQLPGGIRIEPMPPVSRAHERHNLRCNLSVLANRQQPDRNGQLKPARAA